MKKIPIYIIIILLITIITAGSTYAYLVANINSEVNGVKGEGAELNVVYQEGLPLEGEISPSINKNAGLHTTVNIRRTEDSVEAKTHLFIKVESITPSLASAGFIWEVYKIVETEEETTEEFITTGNFTQCKSSTGTKKCANGDKLYIINDYILSPTNTSFKVYVWIDGSKSGNEVIGASFKGVVLAETEKFTGILE